MASAPANYDGQVSIPLPDDDQLDPTRLEDLKKQGNLNVTRMLAGSGELYDGIKPLVKAVFDMKSVEPRLRELLTLRSAVLLNCPYEWQANAIMAKNVGLSQADMDAVIVDGDVTAFDERTNLALAVLDQLTRTGSLTDESLVKLQAAFELTVCRELMLLIGWLNLLPRFLNGAAYLLSLTISSAQEPRRSERAGVDLGRETVARLRRSGP